MLFGYPAHVKNMYSLQNCVCVCVCVCKVLHACVAIYRNFVVKKVLEEDSDSRIFWKKALEDDSDFTN